MHATINDLAFEIEPLKQVDIDADFILMLVQKYHDTNCTNKLEGFLERFSNMGSE